MEIYPAIDLHRGRVVRLYQGDYQQVTDYHADPVALAQAYAAQGAGCIHVVDLDGAKSGDFVNLQTIERMAAALEIPLQSGGGIRQRADLQQLIDAGVGRAVIGSLAVQQPRLVTDWLVELGPDRICLAMDVKVGAGGEFMLTTSGWTETAALTLWDGLTAFEQGRHVLCTDISRDGTLRGPNAALYQECSARLPQLQIQASGGVGSLDDIATLAATSASGVIIGKALLDGRFTVAEALRCSRGA